MKTSNANQHQGHCIEAANLELLHAAADLALEPGPPRDVIELSRDPDVWDYEVPIDPIAGTSPKNNECMSPN